MSITRTVDISDLTPEEMAEIFTNWSNHDQAAFFNRLDAFTKGWYGAGWCQQSCMIAGSLDDGGREAIKTLAGHVDPKIDAAFVLAIELGDLVAWLDANQRTIEGEFSMDDLLAGPRAALARADGK